MIKHTTNREEESQGRRYFFPETSMALVWKTKEKADATELSSRPAIKFSTGLIPTGLQNCYIAIVALCVCVCVCVCVVFLL